MNSIYACAHLAISLALLNSELDQPVYEAGGITNLDKAKEIIENVIKGLSKK